MYNKKNHFSRTYKHTHAQMYVVIFNLLVQSKFYCYTYNRSNRLFFRQLNIKYGFVNVKHKPISEFHIAKKPFSAYILTMQVVQTVYFYVIVNIHSTIR